MSGWLRRGLPRRMLRDEVGLRQLATIVYAQLAIWNQPGTKRDAREQRLLHSAQFTAFLLNTRERRRVREEVRRWAARFQRAAWLIDYEPSDSNEHIQLLPPGRGRRQGRGIELFAHTLGVKPELVKGWIDRGAVDPLMLAAYRKFETGVEVSRVELEPDKLLMLDLMERARQPQTRAVYVTRKDATTGRRVRVEREREEPVTSDIRTGDGPFGGDMTSGHKWRLRIGEFVKPVLDIGEPGARRQGVDGYGLLERMVEFARGIAALPARRFDQWVIMTVSAELVREGGGTPKYGKAVRMLGHERSRDFVVNEPASSGNKSSREEALAVFTERFKEVLGSHNLTYVHGFVVWQYRRRTPREIELRVEARRLGAKIEKVRAGRVAQARKRREKRARRSRVVVDLLAARQKRERE